MRVLVLFFLFCGFSCSPEIKTTSDSLVEYLETFDYENISQVAIIYIDGCPGCHDLQKNLLYSATQTANSATIIVTKSPKKAKLLFGADLMNSVKFDTENLAFKLALIDNYPIVYKINKGSISDSIVIQTNEIIFESFH